MLRLGILLIWLISCSVNYAPRAEPVFGVRVSIGSNSRLCTYVCYLYNGRVLTNKRIVDEQTFIKIVSGEWPSIYNPNRLNYFEENSVSCGMITDSIAQEKQGYCPPLDSLWKIRFATYPFKHRTDMGWSNKYHKPAPQQEKYLYDRYDVEHVDSKFFLDTNFWRLLRDVKDTNWIKNYKSLR